MEKFEYMTLETNESIPLKKALNDYGNKGWELVTVCHTCKELLYIFKRRIHEGKDN